MLINWSKVVSQTMTFLNCLAVICAVLAVLDHLFLLVPQSPDERRQLLNMDDFVLDPNDSYSPSMYVQYGHKITNQQFQPTMVYLKRALYAPIITFGLGFLAMKLLLLALLCRCCFTCCKCLPDGNDKDFEYKRLFNTVIFYFLCFFVLLFDQLVFLGNDELTVGVNTIKSTIGSMEDLFTNLYDDAGQLYLYAGDLSSEVTSAQSSCPAGSSYWTDAQSQISSFQSTTNSLMNDIKPLNKDLDKVISYLNKYAIEYRTIALYVIWGLAIVSVFFFVLSKCCETVCGMQLSAAFAVLVYYLYLVLGVPWILITEVGGDLCMMPDYNIVSSLPQGTLQDIATFYATCRGNNTLQLLTNSAYSGAQSLNSTLASARELCGEGNTDIQHMQVSVDGIFSEISDVNTLLDCPNLHAFWFDFVNKGFCTQLYQGVFYIWGSQLVTSFLLFCLILTSVFSWQYFSTVKVAPARLQQDEDDEEEAEAHYVDTHDAPDKKNVEMEVYNG